jgi:hypothetical protein
VPCGSSSHAIRWEAGQLSLPAHPDIEAELVLAALGGDKPRCVEVAETWAAHAGDLDVLMAGPRSRADQVTVNWDDAEEHRANWFGLPSAPRSVPRLPAPPIAGGGSRPGIGPRPGRIVPGRLPEELQRRVQARIEVLHLLALGPAFQFRLAGAVTAAWAARPAGGRRPELVAALSGRLAPAVGQWLGIDPDAVIVTPWETGDSADAGPAGEAPATEGSGTKNSVRPGWGMLTATGSGAGRRARASLPVSWLASAWACGLTVVDGHLVVAVEEPGWPRARVLALPAPDEPPVNLDVTGIVESPEALDDTGAPGNAAPALPRWTASGTV